jgi:hypothetical protein
VTKLGEFSTTGRLFSLCSFWKTTEVARRFKQLFSTEKVMLIVLKVLVGLHFGRLFSHTHLVTLAIGDTLAL